MSKAFTRESDDAPEQRPAARPSQPPGRITASGAQSLRESLKQLNPFKESENDKIKSRIADLERILATAEIIPPPPPPWEQVLFGATVTVRDDAGLESQYRIVGTEEFDPEKNWILATSPIARALLKTRLGQRASLRLPDGEQHLTVTGINYE